MDFKYCQHCGQKMPVDSEFCPHCGTKQISETQMDQDPQYQQRPNYNYRPAPSQPTYQQGYRPNSGYIHKVRITPPPCSFKVAWLAFWHQYGHGHGYTSRAEYWKMILNLCILSIIVLIPVMILYSIIGNASEFIWWVYCVIISIPSISMEARRLRDAGVRKDGWITALIISTFIPFVNFIMNFVVLFLLAEPSVRYRR